MEAYDPNFHDTSGFLSIILGLVVLVGMACLPAVIRLVQILG